MKRSIEEQLRLVEEAKRKYTTGTAYVTTSGRYTNIINANHIFKYGWFGDDIYVYGYPDLPGFVFKDGVWATISYPSYSNDEVVIISSRKSKLRTILTVDQS